MPQAGKEKQNMKKAIHSLRSALSNIAGQVRFSFAGRYFYAYFYFFSFYFSGVNGRNLARPAAVC